mgnify:CR=1 FL=1
MGRVEDIINAAKTNEMLSELLHIKKEEEKKQNVLMWVLIVGCETNAFFAATENIVSLRRIIWKILMKTSMMITTMISLMMRTKTRMIQKSKSF